jgi:hypothetical protein
MENFCSSRKSTPIKLIVIIDRSVSSRAPSLDGSKMISCSGPSRPFCGPRKGQWRLPVCGSLPFRPYHLFRIVACHAFSDAWHSRLSFLRPYHTYDGSMFSSLACQSLEIQISDELLRLKVAAKLRHTKSRETPEQEGRGSGVRPVELERALWAPLQATHQQQDNQNEQYQYQAAARVVAPSAAIGPRRKCSQQQQNEHDKQNESHCTLLTGAASFLH